MKRYLLLFFLLLVPTVFALSEQALLINQSIQNAREGMQELKEQNFTTIRYNDTLGVAIQLFEAQLLLENSTGNADYSFVKEKLNELELIKKNAFESFDQLEALELTLNQIEGVDITTAQACYQHATAAFIG